MFKNKNNTITILDIGSSKFVCIMVNSKMDILAVEHHMSYGIRNGVITDLKVCQEVIIKIINNIEKTTGIKCNNIYITLSENIMISQQMNLHTSTIGKTITSKDINKLLLEVIQLCKNQKLDIIHTFACNYILDGYKGILNPLGMYGNSLECQFHILAVPYNHIVNINNLFAKTNININGYIANTYASGLACLTKDELHLGVIIIEFGAGTTSFGIFEKNKLIYLDTIPLGGYHITNDIAKGLKISFEMAERIKNLYGGLIISSNDKNERIELSEDEVFTRSDLIHIIQARIDEIIELLLLKISHNYLVENYHVVITGGGSKINNIKDFLEKKLKTKIRIGLPNKILYKNRNIAIPEFSSIIGALIHLQEDLSEIKNDKLHSNNIISWLKKNFWD
jgi:cell division protein FtsA